MEWLLNLGYFGLFVGSFLAATLIPFSSDFLLLGMLAAGGNIWGCVVAASLGNWAGGMFTYWLGRRGKWKWIEKWFGVKPETLEKQKSKIDRYGSAIALFTWVPGIGDVLSLGLGFYRTNPKKTAVLMLVGKSVRFVMWALLFLFSKDYLFPDL